MSAVDEVPEPVRFFIERHIPTVGHMEALALLIEEPETAWTVALVSRRLYVAEVRADGLLRDLSRTGLLARDESGGSWRFAPPDPEERTRSLEAVTCYRQRLIPVTFLIQSRQEAGARFADAFRLRRS